MKHNAKGESRTRLYETYKQMLERTKNKNNPKYENYGGRGIKVCLEWENDFQKFKGWALANGYDENAPKGQCTIDRINNGGDYEPSNCRIITIQEQQFNRSSNHLLTYNKKTQTLTEWGKELGIDPKTLEKRCRLGWSDEKIITTPVDKRYSTRKKVD